ncbi:hypothetical protein CSB09_00420 [Candidatus Gracilibacteria bacterium]|nr:MAG: hypothetical protein CSB09_00420 [Candidatus Gracilibacteria bacterium]
MFTRNSQNLYIVFRSSPNKNLTGQNDTLPNGGFSKFDGLNTSEKPNTIVPKPNFVSPEKQKKIQNAVDAILSALSPLQKEKIISIIESDLFPKDPKKVNFLLDTFKKTMATEITAVRQNTKLSREQQAKKIYDIIIYYTNLQVTALHKSMDTGNYA